MKTYSAYIVSISLVVALGFGSSSCKEDEPARPKLSFSEPSMSVGENAGVIEVELVLDKSYGKDLTIEYTLGGTASDQDAVGSATADYEVIGDHGVVVIESGTTSGAIELEIINDATFEADETIEISILDINTGDVELTADDETEITITNDDSQLIASFATTTMTVNEADGADGLIEVTVQLDKQAPTEITVPYTIKIDLDDETRSDAIDETWGSENDVDPFYYDYNIEGVTGQLVIPSGSTSANIEIQLYSDFTFENDETIEITITGTDNVQPGTNKTIIINLEQENGKVIALIWENEAYTDVDMDLFLWYSPGADSLRVAGLSANGAVSPRLETVFVPSTLTNGRFGLSHNYYSGSADPLNFEVQFADFANDVVEPLADREVFNATYTAANKNPWAESEVFPPVVQTFKIVAGAYVETTQIAVPSSGSRMKTNKVPAGIRRTERSHTTPFSWR